eukprot:TRINITY_DN6354_c0_g1_i1.p2 TRINITY_DN6354_c0_g1~~TRINITY_DN6354_c0_g1_i1.p2  ORF type:complete len:90 (+),score=11.44 TRINITY_DN6354_c0_g1_i1:187-456(+)
MTDLRLLFEEGRCLRYLEDLAIDSAALSDADFKWIPLIGPNLRSLCILNCGFTTNRFRLLLGLKNLSHLDIRDNVGNGADLRLFEIGDL